MISPDSLSGGDQVLALRSVPVGRSNPWPGGQSVRSLARVCIKSRVNSSDLEKWVSSGALGNSEMSQSFRFEKVGKLGAGGYTVLNGISHIPLRRSGHGAIPCGAWNEYGKNATEPSPAGERRDHP
jgi:hypothetical protein